MKKIILLFIFITICSAGLFYYQKLNKIQTLSKKEKSVDKYHTVKKGDMNIGLTLSGTVNSKKKHKLSLEVAYNTKLLWIIDENTTVKKGDILASFETEELVEKIDDIDLSLENYQKELKIEKTEGEILKSSNIVLLRRAKDSVIESEATFNKYWRLEAPKIKDEHDLKIKNTKQDLQQANDDYYEQKIEISKTVYLNKSKQLESEEKLIKLEKDKDNAKLAYDNAMYNRKIFKKYTYPDKIVVLKNKVEQSKLDLLKTKVQIESSEIKHANSIGQLEKKIRNEEKELEKYKLFLTKMQLISPVDGLVIYGDPDKRWNNIEIEIGMQIRRKQTLLTIPDMSSLVVDFDLPEQYRSKLAIGNTGTVTPDSLENLSFPCKITKIPIMPKNLISWDKTSPKIFKSTLEILSPSKEIATGMSVEIEVVTKHLKNVIKIPIEAVFDEGDNYFVYLKLNDTYERRIISIGSSNNKYIEVKKGVHEKDIIYLFKPNKK